MEMYNVGLVNLETASFAGMGDGRITKADDADYDWVAESEGFQLRNRVTAPLI